MGGERGALVRGRCLCPPHRDRHFHAAIRPSSARFARSPLGRRSSSVSLQPNCSFACHARDAGRADAARVIGRIAALAMALLALAPRAEPQSGSLTVPGPAPYGVGERLEYEIRYGPFRGGGGKESTPPGNAPPPPAVHAAFHAGRGTSLL